VAQGEGPEFKPQYRKKKSASSLIAFGDTILCFVLYLSSISNGHILNKIWMKLYCFKALSL
jgi:hypothetical protein